MNKIIVMVDFSANANHVAEYSFKLASSLKMDIVLYCCFEPIISTSELVGDGRANEYSIANHSAGVEKLRQLSVTTRKLAKNFDANAHLPCIRYQWINGMLDPILNLNRDEPGSLIITGSHQKTSSSKLMEGCIKNLVECTGLPVLFVPQGLEFKRFKKIVIITKLKEDEFPTICNVIKFAALFKSEVILTHIISNREVYTHCAKKYFDDLMHLSRYDRVSYQERYQDGQIDLTKLSSQMPHDLFVLIQGNRPLQNENRAMALQQITPLLICHKNIIIKPTQLELSQI